ncbi:subtilisin family serine protease [Kibdelosporangium banguiense]|uniref:Subtilisin family serine protease n=1 Tax=Kibdelosporangium banguiense TaxID=1365924 RepID=A0ABS4U040_9PSEU|nr:S8 family serine peptidase [Kibdelosporangium banguiense]MBP2329589.1 subtilisin family serine protease [Kibdelosporangium banguiense]
MRSRSVRRTGTAPPWRRRVVVTALGALVAVTVAPAAAAAVPPPVVSGQPHASAGAQQPVQRVTLVTGDVVSYAEGAGGPVVSIESASRSGAPAVFETRSGPDGYYVIPSDAASYLAAGVVDAELFNVTKLVKQEGLADAASDSVPVIVSYGDKPSSEVLTRRADDLPASDRTVTLPCTEGAAVRVKRSEAATFWRSLTGEAPGQRPGGTALGGGVTTLRLDHKVKASLDQSVPQIGAPEAWAPPHNLDGTGVTVAVLDTGIDTRHPDLAGRIAESRNFTPDPDASDGHGHGTHVASTLAGSGAASGDRYKGVAPGARLLNGKVLGSDGGGDVSQLMAGMDWAAHAGARVINMSLGAGPTDGQDPLSECVDALTNETGALFVVAAGNVPEGNIASVEAPAAATSALAVGAVTKSDQMAGFSARGPRLGDAMVKPEIVAPGVDIVAARAAGTNLGKPVGEQYTQLSGTSMATPHVAGAAALLAQKHPKWTAGELKGLLTSSAKDIGAAWYEQGAGRVDIPAALASTVAGPPPVSFGRLSLADTQVVRRAVTYTNSTDRDMTLSLTFSATAWNGTTASPGMVSLDKDTLVVPAKSTATASVTLDPAVSRTTRPAGAYGGVITATDTAGGSVARTPFSFYAEPETHPLTLKLTDSRGNAPTPSRLTIVRDDYDWANPKNNDPFIPATFTVPVVNGTGTILVPKGQYSTTALTYEDQADVRRATLLAAAEVPVTGPTTITLDARTAVPMQVQTKDPTETRERFTSIQRHLPGMPMPHAAGVLTGPGWQHYITPTAPAKRGTVGSQDHLTLSQPQAEPARSHPKYMYNLYFRDRNGIPAPHVNKADPATLAAVDTRYHADKPDILFTKKWFALPTDTPSGMALNGTRFRGPGQWTEYIGPVDDTVLWKRFVVQNAPRPDGTPDPATTFFQLSHNVYRTAGPQPPERWFQAPIHGGAATHTGDAPFPMLCSLCRDANGDFLPAVQWMDSMRGHFAEPGLAGHYPSKVRLFRGEEEIPGKVGPLPIPLFPLGQQSGTYRLEVEDTWPDNPKPFWPNGAVHRLAPRISTVATFNSTPPAGNLPPGYTCLDGGTKCAFQPIIQLDYQLGLDLLNQAPAGRTHTFEVTAGHHNAAEGRGEINEFQLEYSTNDGTSWYSATVVHKGGDTYTIQIPHPNLEATTGFISLRAKASDSVGNRIEQTIHRAYALTNNPTP